MESYKDVFQALKAAKVDYLIVGGVAMNLLGCPRFTNDLDILLALDPKNLQAMEKAMEKLGYEQRVPVALDELGDEKKALNLIKEKHLDAYTFVNPKELVYSVDIVVGPSLQFDRFKKNRVFLDVWGFSLPVISIDDLIGLKRKTHRKKDAMDVAMLLEYKAQ